MRACRSVLLAFLVLIGCATGGVAIAAEQSAQDFLGAIYATYKGKDAKGIDLNRRGATARYFSPSLARLIDADARAAAKRGDVPTLGCRPVHRRAGLRDFRSRDHRGRAGDRTRRSAR